MLYNSPIMKKIFLLLGTFLLLFTFADFFAEFREVYSQAPFSSSFLTTYDISENGETTVTQEITITNKQEDVLLSVYSFSLNQIEVYDVKGSDSEGKLDVDIKRDPEDSKTTITLKLNDSAIGKDKSSKIIISYKTRDLVNKVGKVWSLNFPKVGNLADSENYKVILKVPQSFGRQIFISPLPEERETEGNKIIYTYNKMSLQNTSIMANFGENQILNFELRYDLINSSILPKKQIIALPPDIALYQQIYFASISPAPLYLKRDIDGNTLATFRIKPKQSLQVTARGSAKILGRQIFPEMGGKMHEIPENLKKIYTKDDLYWEVSDPKIREIAEKLFDPHKTVAENAHKVHNYVVENLTYMEVAESSQDIERKGAVKALDKGENVCMEFTDLFVALTRAMGIPAREINGYAISNGERVSPLEVDFNNKDILHSWAEFYDPKFGWVQVDPAWENTSQIDYFTKLDTNHLAFVIKGLDSEYPLPAGSYRTSEDKRQIFIDFAKGKEEFKPKINIKKAPSWNPIALAQKKKKYLAIYQSGPILYSFGDLKYNFDLFPFTKEKFFLDKDTKTVQYQDINGQKGEISLPAN